MCPVLLSLPLLLALLTLALLLLLTLALLAFLRLPLSLLPQALTALLLAEPRLVLILLRPCLCTCSGSVAVTLWHEGGGERGQYVNRREYHVARLVLREHEAITHPTGGCQLDDFVHD